VLISKSGTVLTFAISQSIQGTIGTGSNSYNWDNHGENGTIKGTWGDLQAGCSYRYESSASTDLNAIWSAIKSGIGEIKDVVAVVGQAFG
jgi:hypothetical protein